MLSTGFGMQSPPKKKQMKMQIGNTIAHPSEAKNNFTASFHLRRSRYVTNNTKTTAAIAAIAHHSPSSSHAKSFPVSRNQGVSRIAPAVTLQSRSAPYHLPNRKLINFTVIP